MKWVALEALALESLASKAGRRAKKAEKVHEATEHPHPVAKVGETEKENNQDVSTNPSRLRHRFQVAVET
jgi:hypothetical protein